MKHKSVMVDEAISFLNLLPGKTYLDATFGGGGHTRAILEHEPNCNVIAMDWDRKQIETVGEDMVEEFGDRLQLIWGNFSLICKKLKKAKIQKIDGVLADFGTSQIQIGGGKGFSVHNDTFLDMRMSTSDHQVMAADVINRSSEEKIREIIWQLGQDSAAKQIARAIVERRRRKRITRTGDLVAIIEEAVGKRYKSRLHPATKVFQALRIYVNHELQNIEGLLAGSLRVLNPGGRLVCISFHSLEDRIVKRFIKENASCEPPKLKILTKKAARPTEEEIEENRAARSAKMRAAEMLF